MDFIPANIKPYLNFIHPALMWILLATSLYAMYLGFQIRKTRNATGEEKKQLIQGKYNLRHYQIGSIVLAVMVLGTLIGDGSYLHQQWQIICRPAFARWLGDDWRDCSLSFAVSLYAKRGGLG